MVLGNKIEAVGAEAEISFGNYLGKESAVKNRVVKKYRNAVLDSRIRKERTKQEALLLHRAKEAGVMAPFIYKIDRKGSAITMEKVDGKLLRKTLDEDNYRGICKEIGKKVALLHMNGIVHGDLTTSNIILRDKDLVFIDFGLGFFSGKAEDFAVDLLNFKKTYSATHFRLEKGWGILAESYEKKFGRGKEVVRLIEGIEKRARYF